jgi:hypothetical protein
MLFKVLSLYPLVPPAHYQLSKIATDEEGENQKLLEESLATHREETRQAVKCFLTNPLTFVLKGNCFRWRASRAEMEWILQVLNEVRVGSWLALGAPDLQEPAPPHPTAGIESHYWAMDIAGGFQMIFVAALSGELPLQAD